MNLRAKLTTALAGTTSQNPISTENLSIKLRGVKAELQAMLRVHEVCHCKIAQRGHQAVDVWWLPGTILNANYNQTTKANKMARARARARLLEVEDE